MHACAILQRAPNPCLISHMEKNIWPWLTFWLDYWGRGSFYWLKASFIHFTLLMVPKSSNSVEWHNDAVWPPDDPGLVNVLRWWQGCSCDVLCSLCYTLESLPVLGSTVPIPDSDGAGKHTFHCVPIENHYTRVLRYFAWQYCIDVRTQSINLIRLWSWSYWKAHTHTAYLDYVSVKNYTTIGPKLND